MRIFSGDLQAGKQEVKGICLRAPSWGQAPLWGYAYTTKIDGKRVNSVKDPREGEHGRLILGALRGKKRHKKSQRGALKGMGVWSDSCKTEGKILGKGETQPLSGGKHLLSQRGKRGRARSVLDERRSKRG